MSPDAQKVIEGARVIVIMNSAQSKKPPVKKLLNLILALSGLGLYFHLVRSSGMGGEIHFEPKFALALALISLLPSLFDALAWRVAAIGFEKARRVPLMSLIWLRIAGEGVTNGIPGGVVIAETYKAIKLKDWFSASVSQSTPGLLLMKLCLGFSQGLFILLGLSLAFYRIRDGSVEAFGIAGAHFITLALVLFMCTLFLGCGYLMYLGRPFARIMGALSVIPHAGLRTFLKEKQNDVKELDANCTAIVRDHRKSIALMVLFLMGRWFSMAGENWAILGGLGMLPEKLGDALLVAVIIESVGSLFRLVFFLVPSGIGGQDASFFALFRLYGWGAPTAGAYIVIKRLKEVIWIGLGFLVILITRIFDIRFQLPESSSLDADEVRTHSA